MPLSPVFTDRYLFSYLAEQSATPSRHQIIATHFCPGCNFWLREITKEFHSLIFFFQWNFLVRINKNNPALTCRPGIKPPHWLTSPHTHTRLYFQRRNFVDLYCACFWLSGARYQGGLYAIAHSYKRWHESLIGIWHRQIIRDAE